MTSGISVAPIEAPTPADELFSILYAELHRLARREIRRRQPFARLSATTLLHEAYLSISSREEAIFPDHPRFMAYAARVMRGLIVDEIRRQRSGKHGGHFHITALGTRHAPAIVHPSQVLRISEALDALTNVDPPLAEIIELKFFCGFSFGEIASMRGVSERTIQRGWEKGRLYLQYVLAQAHTAADSADAAIPA